MKLSTLVLLSATLFSAMNGVNACIEGDGHANHSGMMGTPDTKELNIYDSVEKLMSPVKKTRISNPTNRLGLRVDINGDGFDDGPQSEPFLGLPMRYPTFPHPNADNNIALALIHNGRQIVLWGPNTARNLGPQIMGFFMQHEFAHHDLEHTTGTRNHLTSAQKEAESDCQAAQALVEYGRSDVIPEVVNWFARQGCYYDPGTPIEHVQSSHPCGTQRANIVRQCAGM